MRLGVEGLFGWCYVKLKKLEPEPEVKTADSLQPKTSSCLMAYGKLWCIWSQFLYAKKTPNLVILALKVTLFQLVRLILEDPSIRHFQLLVSISLQSESTIQFQF